MLPFHFSDFYLYLIDIDSCVKLLWGFVFLVFIGRVVSKHGHPKDYAIAFEFAEAALEISTDGIQKAKLLVFMNQLRVR